MIFPENLQIVMKVATMFHLVIHLEKDFPLHSMLSTDSKKTVSKPEQREEHEILFQFYTALKIRKAFTCVGYTEPCERAVAHLLQ